MLYVPPAAVRYCSCPAAQLITAITGTFYFVNKNFSTACREKEPNSRNIQVGGSKDLAFEGLDMDGDFDPDEYDKQMAAVFDKYDQVDVENEGERPEFSDDDSDIEMELETENWDEWTGEEREEGGDDEEAGYVRFVWDSFGERGLSLSTEYRMAMLV